MLKKRRSLKVRSKCITKVKLAVWRNGFPRQRDLAVELDISLSTVSNYLNARPVAILNFIEISEKLGFQDWKEIVDWDEPQVKDISGIKTEN
jgi:serine/threonine-protein kinase